MTISMYIPNNTMEIVCYRNQDYISLIYNTFLLSRKFDTFDELNF